MKKLGLLVLVMLTFLFSCQLQKVAVNLYTPARLVFPPEVKSVLITSRYVPAQGPYEDVQWGAYESVDSLKWSLSESIVDSLGKRMATDNKYLVKIKHYPRMLRHNEANLPEPLPWPGLSDLAKKEYVQSLVIIEGFGIDRTPVKTISSGNDFKATFSVGITLAIRAYEPEKMRIIDDSVYTFFSEFEGRGPSEQEAARQLPDDWNCMVKACDNAAESYFNLINPGMVKTDRHYYTKGDSALIEADLAVRQGKWGRAESKWKWLAYNAEDSMVQAKASFNMALACERDGRLNQAIGFARRSERIHPDKRTREYIEVLNEKMKEYEELLKQQKILRRW